ncbi:hypothetical protein D3C78_1350640 [compost metagenome]
MLVIKLRTGSGDVIARAEHLQIILQGFHAGGTHRCVFDLLIPEIGSRIASGVGFRHLPQHRKAFIAAPALEQKLRQRVLQLRIAGAGEINFFELIDRFNATRRVLRNNGPVFRRQRIVWWIA